MNPSSEILLLFSYASFTSSMFTLKSQGDIIKHCPTLLVLLKTRFPHSSNIGTAKRHTAQFQTHSITNLSSHYHFSFKIITRRLIKIIHIDYNFVFTLCRSSNYSSRVFCTSSSPTAIIPILLQFPLSLYSRTTLYSRFILIHFPFYSYIYRFLPFSFPL